MTVARTLTAVRRSLLTLLGLQIALAVGLSLVDSYRRRGKKPKAFPVLPPETVPMPPQVGVPPTKTDASTGSR